MRTKARVASTKANDELITAMAESQTAGLAAMSAKIASRLLAHFLLMLLFALPVWLLVLAY